MSAEPAVPPLRPITRFYTGGLAAAAACALAGLLLRAGVPSGQTALAVLGLTACLVLAMIRPIVFTHRVMVNLDTTVVLAALLTLKPGYALLVAAAGAAIAGFIERPTAAEALFNTAQLALQAAAGAAAFALAGWDPSRADFRLPAPVLATLLAGAAMYAVNTLALAGVIGLQERLSILGVWSDIVLRASRTERFAELAQLGIGLLAAVIAHTHAWALALLFIPMAAVYFALQQHVDMRRRAEANLAAAQRLVGLGSWDWDLRTGDQRWSGELFHLLGLLPGETPATTASYLGVVHPDDRPAVAAAVGAAASTGTPFQLDHRVLPGNGGAMRIVHARGEVVPGKQGRPARVVGTVHDITERKRLEEQLAHQAHHDPLTDLPNRLHFTERLDETLRRAGKRTALAVLFLDLDRFKLINDTFGHEAGDALLIAVADRLRACVRPEDVVARLGGDEFTVLLTNVASTAEATRVANRIIAAITEPIELPDNREVVVSTSIGIVRPGRGHATGADLLRDADNALYRAKEQGRNRYALFDATMRAATQERVAIEADLRRAIERDELRVRYQPKVDLVTGRTVGVEALLRWEHPTRGSIPPLAFIPIAEETGLIQQIGRWVLREACREAARWPAADGAPPPLGVNLTGRQLHDPDLVTELGQALREAGLPPSRLRLEVAEAVAMRNPEATIEALARLQRLGVRVVIDDFGIGYSNLGSLQRFTVDALQIDRSVVADLGQSQAATTIADAAIGVARGLKLAVVAEGVERPEQAAQLRALGCELAQGYLFAGPLTADDLAVYLAGPPASLVSAPELSGYTA